jgi:DNA-binding CsgD family transcriptional regulator
MATRVEVPFALSEAAKAVAASRGRFLQLQQTFDRSCIPMILVDNDRRLVEVNRAARLLSRMSLREARGVRIDDITTGPHLAALYGAWNELLRRGALSDRYLVSFRDGGTLWIYYAALANALPGLHLVVFVPADWPGNELEELHDAPQPDLLGPLSTRQVEVLRLVAVGASAPEIADELCISDATVRTHVKNILERLGAKNRAHAVALALRDGLLGDDPTRDGSRTNGRRGPDALHRNGHGSNGHGG